MNENNKNLNTAASDELDRKRTQKIALIKISSMLLLSVIMLIFSSIAWFTQNTDNTATGMQIVAAGPSYEISVMTDGSDGVYDDYLDLVHDSSAIVWKMKGTDANGLEQNMGNYYSIAGRTDDGIYPGCSGYITFYVTPKVDSVNLDFTFELLGYNAETESGTTTMTQLDETNDADVIGYLDGHILLFESYDKTTHKYSGLIKNTTDLSRLLSNKTYTGKNIPTTVNIYWVWAENLSDLLETETVTIHDEETDEDVEVTRYKFCDDADFASYIEGHPQYFMKGVTTADNVTISTIQGNYQYYGGRYNLADNVIGSRVRFLLLTMTVSVS